MTAMLAYQNVGSSRARKMEQPREDFAMSAQTSQAKKAAVAIKPATVVSAFHLVSRANNPVVEVRATEVASSDSGGDHGKIYQSSGSEHEPSSVCLAAMVDEFMEEAAFGKCRSKNPCSSKGDERGSDLGGEVLDYLKGFTACSSEEELALLSDVTAAVTVVKNKAMEICNEGMDCASGCAKRATLRSLRSAGHNAAICKSRWDHGGGFPGGDYEYIDVLIERSDGKLERLIVDIDFRGQFEIARPTDRYTAIVHELPAIFVGGAERLQQIVNLMCNGVKESLKKRGMPLPPWRKLEYMRAKWLSAYKRTTNESPPRHETSDDKRELLNTAMLRGSRWHSRFTNEVELLMVERNDTSTSTATAITITANTSELQQSNKKFTEPGNSSLLPSRRGRGGNEITAVATEWKPPAVGSSRKVKPAGMAGLASVLIEAGLSTLASEQRASSRKPCMVAVS
ncbi:uncharacterized protein LOC9636096 [Selaginella moellendorffii]|nr:uncharacterized protein LOC9636096 [Selaginella moellendorffii]|eukprot:XP_002967161.2 uncharacterized protein LOC9636096 [Selaginella moellendorffii]